MSENNQQQQSNTEQYIEQLTQLIGKAKEQNQTQLVPALEAALEALKEKNDKGDEQDSSGDFKMSGYTAQEQLLALSEKVKQGLASKVDRTVAARHLAALAGKR